MNLSKVTQPGEQVMPLPAPLPLPSPLQLPGASAISPRQARGLRGTWVAPRTLLALTNVGAGAQEGSVSPGSCRERVGCSVDGTWGREVGDADEAEWAQAGP